MVPATPVATAPHFHTLTGKEERPGWNKNNAYFRKFEPEWTFSSYSVEQLGITHKAPRRLSIGGSREHACKLQANLPAAFR